MRSSLARCGLLALVVMCCLASDELGVLVIRQVESEALVSQVSAITGSVMATSNVSWDYTAPLVEATYDTRHHWYYVVTYPNPAQLSPESGSGASVYVFDEDLHLVKLYEPKVLPLFDLQWNARDETLYGIAVTSQYGRTLSRFLLVDDHTITATHLLVLPYMWYVNASTFAFSKETSPTYYGLLNNFSGQHNSTAAQKLMAYRTISHTNQILDVPEATEKGQKLTLHFINAAKYGNSVDEGTFDLMALAEESDTGALHFVRLDGISQSNVTLKTVLQLDEKYHTVGPLFSSYDPFQPDVAYYLCAFVMNAQMGDATCMVCVWNTPNHQGWVDEEITCYQNFFGTAAAVANRGQ